MSVTERKSETRMVTRTIQKPSRGSTIPIRSIGPVPPPLGIARERTDAVGWLVEIDADADRFEWLSIEKQAADLDPYWSGDRRMDRQGGTDPLLLHADFLNFKQSGVCRYRAGRRREAPQAEHRDDSRGNDDFSADAARQPSDRASVAGDRGSGQIKAVERGKQEQSGDQRELGQEHATIVGIPKRWDGLHLHDRQQQARQRQHAYDQWDSA